MYHIALILCKVCKGKNWARAKFFMLQTYAMLYKYYYK